MIGFFYSRLASQSIRRNPGLAAVMVLGLALGIATWVTSRAALRGARRNPLPGHPDLYQVSLVRPPLFDDVPRSNRVEDGRMEVGPRFAVSERDVAAILAASRAPTRIAATVAGHAAVRQRSGAWDVDGVRFAGRDLFAMFDLDFARGGLWSEADDAAGNPVLVIDEETARFRFGGAEPLGQTIEIAGTPFRVVGVLRGGRREKIFDQIFFGHETERYFAPFAARRRFHIDPEYAFDAARPPGPPEHRRENELAAFVWIELPRDRVAAFVADERAAGLEARVLPFMEFRGQFYYLHPAYLLLDLFAHVTLVASALNLVRLLLAKFSSRANLSGIHRALGASRRSIFAVHVIEAKIIGIAAGFLGLGLGAVTVPLMNAFIPDRVADAVIDGTAIVVTVCVAVVVGLTAGIYPAWRTAREAPAVFLKRN